MASCKISSVAFICHATTGFFGYAAILYAVYLIPDTHLRLWTAIVVIIGFPAWSMAGFIVYGMSSRTPERLWGEESPHPSARRIRRRGGIVFLLGAAAWCYGTFGSNLPRQIELVVLAVALYGLVLGGYWFLSGRKLA
jgi:hypothetical protein